MKTLILILLTLDAVAQCTASIDSATNNFCLSPLANKTFTKAVASGGTIIEWITSGSGIFENKALVQARYLPSAADRTRGYVHIYLYVLRDSTCSVLPAVTLNFTTMRATSIPGNQTKCTGVPITPIIHSTGLSHSTYRWTRNNTTSATGMASSGTGNISGTLINKSTIPITVTFTITPVTSSCTGTPTTVQVIVNPCLITHTKL